MSTDDLALTGADGSADPYALWDAAYVLGSLSSAQRREYEDHLAQCKACRTAMSELSGMPALLALVNRDEMIHAEDERPPEPPPLSPRVLTTLLQKVGLQRRRSRWVSIAVAATAAAVLLLGVLVALRPAVLTPTAPLSRVSESALTMTPLEPSAFEASVTLTTHGWGTQIDMMCTYHSWSADTTEPDNHAGDKLAMVAVGRDGSHTQLATWMALPSSTAHPSASTSMQIDEIAAVQVVSGDTGNVLLQRTL